VAVRIDVALIGSIQDPVSATVFPGSAARQGRPVSPGLSAGCRVAPGAVARSAVVPAPFVGVFVLGETEPTEANTGLNVLGLTTSDLTVVNGDLTVNNAYVSANGPTIDRKWVKGHVLMTATTPVTMTNSFINGRPFAGAAPFEGLVRARNGSAPATATISFVNCRIEPVQPDVGIVTAVGERLGSFTRCHFKNGSDSIDYWNPSVPNVQGSYFAGYSFWDNDPKHTNDGSHPGWSHNDHIQNSGSNGGLIFGNSFDIRAMSGVGNVGTLTASGFPNRNYGCGVMLTCSNARITNIVIRKNWFRFGEVQVCMPLQNGSFDNGNSWSVYDNRHDLGQHGYGGPTTYSHQIIRWGNTEGPVPADVHDNVFLPDANTGALAGTLLPTAVLQGPNNANGQLIVMVNNSTP